MSTPKTLRGFDRQFTEKNARHKEVIYRTPKSDSEWIAYFRDLITAKQELRDLYEAAERVVPRPAERLDSITWGAFRAAIRACDHEIEKLQSQLANYQLASGSTE